ncbi:MAG: diacylglycerol kinase family protein [Flavobacteriaceae bacterium]|nr:diacylglycerol kinase family protein [Flavobacteriaceae bacterium]
MLKAIYIALRGISVAWLQERHMKLHSLAALAVALLAWFAGVDALSWAILLLCVGLVVSLELLNSALERLSNRVTMERDPLIRDAKDMSAAAVLAASMFAAIVGIIVLGPPLWARIMEL